MNADKVAQEFIFMFKLMTALDAREFGHPHQCIHSSSDKSSVGFVLGATTLYTFKRAFLKRDIK